ncbi:MAG: chemotaxis response regulator protein-glutamate methylesterase [Pikeienuella sp.]
MAGQKRTQVLIVDDSAVVRQTLAAIIEAAPDLQVMATANDPYQAAERFRHQVPDVITLDVEMPRMDGITFLRRLMAQRPVPVVVCSSLVGAGSRTLMEALEAGAVDVIQKPAMATKRFLEESTIRIQDAVRAAARARLPLRPIPAAPLVRCPEGQRKPNSQAMAKTTQTIVAIGASTGGTEALRAVLSALPPYAPPIVIVQHMPAGFTRAFAERLDAQAQISVREAADGDSVLRGQALIAPGNQHMRLVRSGAAYQVRIEDGPLVSRHRPSVNVLFTSVAQAAGSNAVGVIMTGMGSDGAAGLKQMREAGALTFGQDEASCVVYGMPKEAAKIGAVMHECGLSELPEMIVEHGREPV